MPGPSPLQPLRRIMMMAFDSSQPPPSRLDEATVAAVRDALRRYLADSTEPHALQQALQRLSADAREKHVQAEQLLVQLKETWAALPEVRSMTDTAEQIRVLQRVVTMCIREYYS